MYLRKFENEDEAKTTFLLLLALGKQPGRGDADFLSLCSPSQCLVPAYAGQQAGGTAVVRLQVPVPTH